MRMHIKDLGKPLAQNEAPTDFSNCHCYCHYECSEPEATLAVWILCIVCLLSSRLPLIFFLPFFL